MFLELKHFSFLQTQNMQEWNKGLPGVSISVYMAVICNTVEMSIQMKTLRLKKKVRNKSSLPFRTNS